MKAFGCGVGLSGNHFFDQEAFVCRANAALTSGGRFGLARLIVDDGWRIARAAERYEVAWPAAKRWAERYRRHGLAGMSDRSWRPYRGLARTPQPLVRTIVRVVEAAAGAGPDRRAVGSVGLERARRP